MKKIIRQLKKQNVAIVQRQSVYTALIPARQKIDLQLTTNEPINLVFTVGAQAQLNLTEIWQQGNTNSQVIISVGSEAKVNYTIDGSRQVSKTIRYQADLNRESEINLFGYLKTNQNFEGQFIIKHQKNHSRGVMALGLNTGGNSQSSLALINHHQGQHTTGDITFKCLGQDRANAYINGLIKIDPPAKFTNSYLTENVLMLSKQSEIKAIPNLEILNNEVKASHSATVGRIDEQVMYYLMSRGLTAAAAKNMLVKGFFKNLFKNAPAIVI
jgi:Fe-S cluster assembly scaffold protein SufB